MVKVIVTVQGKKTAELSLVKEIVVGRREDTDLCLPYSEVSSRHAKLKPSGAGMAICDLGSTNGTYLDGKTKLEAQKEVTIPPGGRVTIGPAILEVEAPPPPPPPPPPPAAKAPPPPRPAAPERDPGSQGTMLVGNVDAKSALVEMAMFEASGARLVVAAQDGRRVVPLDKMEMTVGREDGEIKIAHPSVSKEHARISFQAGGFFIEDLGSSNGSFVEGQRVQGRLPVASHAAVTFGTVPCLFLYDDKKKGADAVPPAAILSHLVGMGKLTQVESDKALKTHMDERKDLGEVLVAGGFLDPSDWSEVWRQRMIIRAVAPTAKSKGISPIVWIALGVILAGLVVFLTRK
jgi:pSer/pThr/pTyr-binding forkhead associated (FHA) protein